jgi:hypothetical protein
MSNKEKNQIMQAKPIYSFRSLNIDYPWGGNRSSAQDGI